MDKVAIESQKNRRFFGRRRGKSLRPSQNEALEVLHQNFVIDVNQQSFNDEIKKFQQIEIGFGDGEHLLNLAKLYSDKKFLGVEAFQLGLAKCAQKMLEDKVENVKIFPDDVGELLDKLPNNHFEKIYVLFPDPWPKRHNRKRRLLNFEILDKLSKLLKVGGELRFATDWSAYSAQVLGIVANYNDELKLQFIDDAKPFSQPWNDYTPTKYYRKSIKEGRPSVFLSFVKLA